MAAGIPISIPLKVRAIIVKTACAVAAAAALAWLLVSVILCIPFALLNVLRASLAFADILFIYAAMNVVEYLAAAFPAKLGPVEGLAYFAFSFLGHNPALGVIAYVLMRLKSVIGNGLIAPLALLDANDKGREQSSALDRSRLSATNP